MLYKRTLYKIMKDTDYEFFDDETQIEYLFHQANFAIDKIKEGKIEDKKELKEHFIGIFINLISLLKGSVMYLKYKNDINALKTRILEIDFKPILKEFDNEDIISFLQVLNELCLIEISEIKTSNKTGKINHNFSRDNIKYFYSDNDLDVIRVSKSAYFSAIVKNDIKYGASKVGNLVLDGTVKVLEKHKNKDI